MRSKLDLIISQRLAEPAINNFMFIVMAVEMSRTQQLQLRCAVSLFQFCWRDSVVFERFSALLTLALSISDPGASCATASR